MTGTGYESLGKFGRMARLVAGALLVVLALGLAFAAGPAGASPTTDPCPSGDCGGGSGDTTAPTVTGISPAESATNVSGSENVTATFSEDMESTTITTSTFTLVKNGTPTPVAATVTYDSVNKRATLNPDADLDSAATYTATVTSGATDLAGNPLDQDSVTAGEQYKSWNFTVRDYTLPSVSLISPSPESGAYLKGAVTLAATASDNVGVVYVQFGFGGCVTEYDFAAPYEVSYDTQANCVDGSRGFFARAVDAADNSSTTAVRQVILDNRAPTLNITSGPNGGSYAAGSTQTWNFSASEDFFVTDETSGIQSVQCSVVKTGDPEDFGPCSGGTTSHSVPNLPVGSYTFSVRATDNAGNVSESLRRSFSIVPLLRISDVRVSERSSNAFFTVRLSAASQQTVTVNYVTANGSAKAPADYATRKSTLTFLPGQTARTIAVPIRNDRRDERTEYFSVRLYGAASATIADSSGRGTIVDND